MPLYKTTGHLTGTILRENVAAAQAYLTNDDMTQFLDEPLTDAVEHIEWKLDGNGNDYEIVAFCRRELTGDELAALSDWCSGQNSDGLGEGFEQQEFAEDEGEEEVDCYNCDGTGVVETAAIQNGEESEEKDCPTCDGAGYFAEESGGMISFDWKSNKLPWTRVK